jgi:type IV pilus assembly protein PilE
MQRTRGFTLIELMIVVAVIAILSSIAITSYKEQMRKSRRATAIQVLSDLALREEKWRSYNATYGTIADLGATTLTNSTNMPYYSVAASALTGTTYTLTATPRSGSVQVGDRCGNYIFTMTNGTVAKTTSTNGSNCY